MIRSILLLLIILLPLISNAQKKVTLIDKAVNPSEVIDELPLPPPELKGNLYITEDWVNGDVWLKNNKVLRGFPIKYDLKNDLLEINANGKIKVCSLPLLGKFTYKEILGDSINYYNTSEVNNLTFDLPKGICRVLLNDKVRLIQYEYIEIIKANYNVALSQGTRDDKAIRKTKAYVIVNEEVFEVQNNFKRNKLIFKNYENKVEAYVKENKLKFRSEEDLIKVFNFYNDFL